MKNGFIEKRDALNPRGDVVMARNHFTSDFCIAAFVGYKKGVMA
jgi:hypothetical protein